LLARELSEIGVAVTRRATVGDDVAAIVETLRDALDRTGAVITTGGLGPTSDDRTRQAVAELFGRRLLADDAVADRLRAWWSGRGLPGELPATNLVQALVPEGARVLENRHGTAPGLWMEDDGGLWVAVLPGVPREMRGLLADELLPLLRTRASGSPAIVVRSRTIRTTGIAESILAERLATLSREVLAADLAFIPSAYGVDLRLTVGGLPAGAADALLDRAAALARAAAGSHVYGEGETDLATTVLEACRARGWRLAIAESCTGGMLGARITAPAGASDVLEGGVISYSNDVKTALLDVPESMLAEHGAVSEPVARQMARGVRARLATEVGVGITGVAGPGGGSEAKPVGTVWIGLDVNGELSAYLLHLPGDRAEIRQRASQAALHLLLRAAG
ncbi:MAG: CinA family nicotinamide mononucleotide deamidase-related protein, partial [Gemmatimonadaceae bacterium]